MTSSDNFMFTLSIFVFNCSMVVAPIITEVTKGWISKNFWTRYAKPNTEKAVDAYYEIANKHGLDLAQM